MTETQRRIRAYKEALPGLRERVVAVALLLAMSMAMMTSASFAWMTISRRPEVTGVNTTIASNGNLEIALATGDGLTAPGESKVGDSSATKGQSITASNITWGNLVNLGDPAYGLDNLTLRPAQLNTSSLQTSPLYGAVYSQDGRVQTLTSSFSYTSWNPPKDNIEGYFGLSQSLGVRAISSVKTTILGFAGAVNDKKEEASSANAIAAGTFTGIVSDTDKMNVLAKLLGIHMTATLNTEDKYTNATITEGELDTLIGMYDAFLLAHEQEADAIAKQLNLELYLAYGGDTSKYTQFTKEQVLAIGTGDARIDQTTGDFTISAAEGKKTVRITDLKTFLADYNMLKTDIATLNAIKANSDYRWTASGLKKVIMNLMNVDQCLVKKQTDSKFQTVKDLMTTFSNGISGMTTALGYKDKKCDVVITNGVLYNFEKRVGTAIKVENLKVTATMEITSLNRIESANIYGYITTSAEKPYHFYEDIRHADTLNTGPATGSEFGDGGAVAAIDDDGDGPDIVAQDTYALAVDLWVRTNNQASFLVLEGNVLTRNEDRIVLGKDANGNEVELYTVDRTETIPAETNEDGTTVEGSEEQKVVTSYDLYKIETTENGQTTTKWYNANTFAEFALTEGEVPKQKIETVAVVIGYEGENRIWDTEDKNYITSDSTSQGSGSCYVYYADTPEDQARSLELLKALKVAFIDANGSLLTTAEMDTDRFFAESGRVIVPLKLSTDSILIGKDEQENAIYGITLLERNVPTRITALVYLDGTMLSNQNVLAAADIQGKLNIQFGTSGELSPIDNEKLEGEERKVSASVSVGSFNYDTHVGEMKTRVTINVDGNEPNQVKAFFLRQINSTQGSREREMTFTFDQNSGTWIADYVFTTPGNYILRTVQLDGMEYELETKPTVTITGFTVESLSCTQANKNRTINVMSADNSASVDLRLKFAADDESKMPRSVQGRFLRDDGTAVNVNFIYNATTQLWSGSATFLASGDYSLHYLVLDGEYEELDEGMWLTASVSLGMRVAVYTTSPKNFKFVPAEMKANEKILNMQVYIMNNAGEVIPGLTGGTLTYRKSTSQVKTLDTNLRWDAAKGYYVGELKTLEVVPEGGTATGKHPGEYGTWIFANVTVDGNTISSATASPTFAMMPPDPPSYNSFVSEPYQYSPAGQTRAKLNAWINYSNAAEVWAVIGTTDGRFEQLVKGTLSGQQNGIADQWLFTIPQRGTGEIKSQEGEWILKTLRIWNYIDANGNEVTGTPEGGEMPDMNTGLTIDLTDKGNTTRVISDVEFHFDANEGNNNRTLNGSFMQEHTFNGINVYFTLKGTDVSLEDAGIEVGDVMLQYEYDGKTQDNGGYYNKDVSQAKTNVFELSFNANGYTGAQGENNRGSTFTQSAAQAVTYAGNYTPYQLSYKIYLKDSASELAAVTVAKDKLPGVNSGVLKVAVKSVTPTVTIQTYLPKGQHNSPAGTDNNSATSKQVTSGVDAAGTTLTIYWKGTAKKGGWSSLWQPIVTLEQEPYVTLRLNGLGKATRAELSFATESNNGTVHLYSGSSSKSGTRTDKYVWDSTTGQDSSRFVGYMDSGNCSSATAAGTLNSSDKLYLYYTINGTEETFEVAISQADRITIIHNRA